MQQLICDESRLPAVIWHLAQKGKVKKEEKKERERDLRRSKKGEREEEEASTTKRWERRKTFPILV